MENLGIRPSLAEVGAGHWHVEVECLEPGLRMTGRLRGTREEAIRHGPTGADEEVKEVIGPVVKLSRWCHRRKEKMPREMPEQRTLWVLALVLKAHQVLGRELLCRKEEAIGG